MNIQELLNNRSNTTNTNNEAPTTNAGAEFVYNAAARGQQDIFTNTDKLDTYIKEGITPVAGENLDEYLIESQSAFTKLGNGIAQALVSELAIGIPKAAFDLIDVVGQALHISNKDYSNPVSKFLEEQQESFRSFAPVYADTNKNILNGGLKDLGWWANNMPSIVSSLTLLVPSTAAVKGIQAIAKAYNIGGKTRGFLAGVTGAAKRVETGQKLNKFQRFVNSDELAKATGLFLENGTTAAISRTMENYQEAHQTYDDMYIQALEYFNDDEEFNAFVQRNKDKLKEEKIDVNNKDEVAKYVAKNAADETFKLDFANTAFDVLQLYALKNVWKNIRNAPDTSRKIKLANKQAASQIGKTTEEIAKLEQSVSKLDKIKNKAINFAVGSKTVAVAELSEGVEESINYIAQQEGISLGNSLLTGEGVHSGFWEKTFGGYDGRLDSYLNSPQLWDAAFWGWLGGVTFQGLGSASRRVYNTIAQKAADKELDEINKAKKPWYYIEQLPEIKRRIEDIRQRNVKFNEYRSKLNDINKGIDVFSDIALQAEGQLNTEELKEAARKRAFNEYVIDLTMSALNNGNYDLLKAYLQDENLRKALIESGLFNGEGKTASEIESESKRFVDDAVRVMEQTANTYDEELMALHRIMIGKKFNGNVPPEVLGIIANDNIYMQQAVNQVNDNMLAVDNEIAKERTRISNNPENQQLDPSIDYENIIKLAVYSQQLAILRKDRKKISRQEDSISKRIALANIDTKIDSIESKLNDEQLIYATAMSLMDIKDNGNGTVSYTANDSFIEYYSNIIEGNPNVPEGGKIVFEKLDTDILKLNSKVLSALTENQRHNYKVLESNINSVFSNLSKISPKLNELYQEKAVYEIQKEHYESYINRTSDNVSRRVGEIMNTLNGARNTAIKRKSEILKDLYKKHGKIIRDIVKYNYDNNDAEYKKALATIPVKDQTLIKDALKIFDFTKSYNQNIAAEIEEMFNKMDRAEIAKQAKDKKDGVEDNSINLQSDSAAENQNIDNTTSEELNGSDEASMQPNGQSQNQSTQPKQPTQNPQPNNNSTSNQNDKVDVIIPSENNKFTIKKLVINPNGNVYEVENEDLALFNDSELYDKGNTVLTRPFKVESKPIVSKNDGKYRLVQRGKLVNTDTEEYKQKQEQEAAKQEAAKQASSPSQIPVTGEVDRSNIPSKPIQTPPVQPVSNPDIDITNTGVSDREPTVDDTIIGIGENTAIEEEAYMSLSSYVTKYILNNRDKITSENFEDEIKAVIEKRINDLVKEGKDRTVLESQIDRIFKLYNSIANRIINKNKSNTFQSVTSELLLETSLGVKDGDIFRTDYKQVLETLLDLYCEEFGVPTINEKKYIDLESIFRFINNINNDNLSARILYYGITEYLNTDEAKSKYVRTDDLNNNKEAAIKKINKTEDERQNERINENLPQRINLNPNSVVEATSTEYNEAKAEMDEAFQSINNGDEIIYEQVDGRIIFKTKDGKILGVNALPSVDISTGVRTMQINGFVYDLVKDKNGNTISKLKDRFYRWLSEDNDSCKQLRDILYALTYDSLSKEKRNSLLDKLYNTFEFQQAIKDGLIIDKDNKSFDISATATHLGNLLKFRNTNNVFNAEVLKASIDNFFDKLYDNYESLFYLSEHPNTEIQASEINDGEIIRISNNATKETCIPATKAIAGGVNPEIHKITYTDANRTTNVSGAYSVTMNFAHGSTHVAIPNRNGYYDYVQAFRSSVNDSFIGEDAKEIVKAIKKQFKKLYKDFVDNKDIDSYNALRNFVLDVFDKNNSSTLFYGVTAFTKNNVLIIRHYKDNKEYKLAIYPNANKVDVTRPEYDPVATENGTYKKKEVSLEDKSIFDTFDYMFDTLEFNMNPKLINSDSFNEDSNVKGIVSKRSNKFTITVGEQSWTYNSFNEFVLNNNLVSLNTKPNKNGTSNYERDTKFKSLSYTIVSEQNSTSQSPVEESHQDVKLDGISKTQRAINILNGTTKVENKGLALYELFNNDTDVLNSLKSFGLLPEDIIFDENFNNEKEHEIHNAKVNNKTKQVTVGTRWLNLFENDRSYAMRVLIHEQLHIKLHSNGNQKYITNINDIFDEFANSISRDSIKHFLEYLKEKRGVPKDKITVTEKEIDTWLNHINEFKYEQYGKDRERIIEEFLVDSLMNGDLIEYLNSVQTNVERTGGRYNLFQKILKLLSDIFGWNIEQGSIREKEFYSLRKVLIDDIKVNTLNNNQFKTKSQNDEVTNTETKDNNIEQNVSDSENVDTTNPIDVSDINIDDLDLNNQNDDIDDLDILNDLDDDRFSSTNEISTSSYTPEMQSIKDKAIIDGTFMKAPNGNPTNLNERQWLQVRTKNFINWFGDWLNSDIYMPSFMPKRNLNIGDNINTPATAANICDNTQIKVLNYIINKFGKPDKKGTYYAKPVTIWAKTPIANKQIHHSTVAIRINGDIYLYDMPQSEYIKYVSENNGIIVKEYTPRLIKYTPLNLKQFYGTSEENIHLNDDVIFDEDIINLPLSKASKIVDENGEPIELWHTSPLSERFDSFDVSDRRIRKTFDGAYDKELMIRDYIDSKYDPFSGKILSDNEFEALRKEAENAVDEIIENDKNKVPTTAIYGAASKEVSNSYSLTVLDEFERLESILDDLDRTLGEGQRENPIDVNEENYNKITGHDRAMYFVVKNPLIIDAQNNNWNNIPFEGKLESTRSLEQIAKDRGKDGIIIKNVIDYGGGQISFDTKATTIAAAWENSQVIDAESATSNNGDFSTTNYDINYSSTNEMELGTSTSELDMRSQLPIQLRPNFDAAVASAAINGRCR